MAKKTVENLQQYWQEIAEKQGLAPEVVASIRDSLGNSDVAKAFRQAFVPVSEHHSTLDEVRGKATARETELQEWYDKTALPAYQSNLAGIERLRKYESTYGDIDGIDPEQPKPSDLGFRNRQEFEKYMEDRLRAERAGNLSLMKALPKMQVDYYNRFKEVLDPNEIEKISVAQGLPPEAAYNAYIAPKVEAQREVEFAEKIKAARDEGRREAISTYKLPVDTTPRESSPFFDRPAAPEKPLTEAQEDAASRSAFADGWNNYAAEIANKNRA